MGESTEETKEKSSSEPDAYRPLPEADRLPPRGLGSGSIVTLKAIAKTFHRGKEPIHVLDNLDLEVPEGSFEALMGPSGSGKSTLLNIIAGLDRPTSGSVTVAGDNLMKMSDSELARWRSQTIGFVFSRST